MAIAIQVTKQKESKIRYQFESKKIFIDNDLNLRSYDELYIDDIGYRTNLNLIYLQFHVNLRIIYLTYFKMLS